MDADDALVNQSSQIFAVSWVKQKAAQLVPERIEDNEFKLSEKKIKKLEEEKVFENVNPAKNKFSSCKVPEGSKGDNDSKSSKEGFDDLKEFDFDNYDNEAGNPELDGTSNLCMFASNYDDPYLSKSKYLKDEDEESDDLNLLDTDNLLVCARCEKDYAQLDIYVYNDETKDFYIHHDLPLPSPPLCLQWLDFDSTNKSCSNQGNFMAVGNMDSIISVWNLDIVNTLDPAFTLGLPKKRHKLMILEGKTNFGHRDAVLDLSWSSLARNKLASASADHLVAIWDLEKLKISQKIKKHNAKVQTLSWQPHSNGCLLSGAFNGRVYISDIRESSSSHLKWSLKDEIERVVWNQANTNYFAASTNTGKISYFDIRKPGKNLFNFKAHDDAIPALSFTSSLLFSGSSDGFVKVWSINCDAAELKCEKQMNMGMVHCLQLNPDARNLLAVGGQKNGIKLWNHLTDKQRAPNEISKDSDDEVNDVTEKNNKKKNLKRKLKKKKNSKHATHQKKKRHKKTTKLEQHKDCNVTEKNEN